MKYRYDDGVHPGVARFYGGAPQYRWDKFFLRLQGEAGAWNVQIGRFTPVFGAFIGGHDIWENPFVNYPLAYEHVAWRARSRHRTRPRRLPRRPHAGNAWVTSYWADVRRQLTPRLYSALRWNHQKYDRLPGGDGKRWDNDAWRIDTALGFRPARALPQSATSRIIWISTVESFGRPETATAARAWRPRSPKISTRRSLAPLTTAGLSANPSTAFTYPHT